MVDLLTIVRLFRKHHEPFFSFFDFWLMEFLAREEKKVPWASKKPSLEIFFFRGKKNVCSCVRRPDPHAPLTATHKKSHSDLVKIAIKFSRIKTDYLFYSVTLSNIIRICP